MHTRSLGVAVVCVLALAACGGTENVTDAGAVIVQKYTGAVDGSGTSAVGMATPALETLLGH